MVEPSACGYHQQNLNQRQNLSYLCREEPQQGQVHVPAVHPRQLGVEPEAGQEDQ